MSRVRVADLYAEPPERFVEARDAFASSLRAKDPALASEVLSLRKPTLALWAVNQVARAHGPGMSRLIDSKARDRKLLDSLVKAAAALLTESGHDATQATLRKVEETLLAAPLAAREDRSALLEGRLGHHLALGDLDTMLALAASRRLERAERPAKPPKRDHGAKARVTREAAKRAAAAAKVAAERLAASAKAAADRAERARADARKAKEAAAAAARDARRRAAEVRKSTRRRAA